MKLTHLWVNFTVTVYVTDPASGRSGLWAVAQESLMHANELGVPLTDGQYKALVQKLGGVRTARLILSDVLKCHVTVAPTSSGIPTTGTWGSIDVCVTAGVVDMYAEDIEAKGMFIAPKAKAMFPNFQTKGNMYRFRLAVRRPCDLGFENDALRKTPYGDIRRRATEEHGLALCPPELALALRLVWAGQARNEWLIVASQGIPMQQPLGGLGLFRLDREIDGRLSLDWANGNDNCMFLNHILFAFVDLS